MTLVISLDDVQDVLNPGAIPKFDIVVADVSADPDNRREALRLLHRLLRVRRPIALIVLDRLEEDFRVAMARALQPYGYDVAANRRDELDSTRV